MKICPVCAREYADAEPRCLQDGVALVRLETSSNDRATDLIGQVVDGRYRVERIVGRGGMGTVYAAKHVVVGKEMAIKVLRSGIERSEEILQRFIREAQAANAVRSRHICEMTDFGQLPNGAFYVVMELLNGISLTRALREHKLSRGQLKRIFIQISETLDKAHRANIVHRDLKPDNVVLIDDDGDPFFVKLVDFGIAKMMESKASNLTETGVILGTPYYMSPEQARGDAVDHRSDIYALGVMMYRAFTGKLPFVADTAMGVLTRHLTQKPELPSRVVAEIDRSVEGIILRCLEKAPADRFQSMAHVAETLRGVPDQPVPRDAHPTLDERSASRRAATPSGVREIDERAAAAITPPTPGPVSLTGSLAFPPAMPLPSAPVSQSGPSPDPRAAAAMGYPAPAWAPHQTGRSGGAGEAAQAVHGGHAAAGGHATAAGGQAAAAPGGHAAAGAHASGGYPAPPTPLGPPGGQPGAAAPGALPPSALPPGASAPEAVAYQPEAYTNRGVVSSRLAIPQPPPAPKTGLWVGIGGALLLAMLVGGVLFAVGGDESHGTAPAAAQTASGAASTADDPIANDPAADDSAADPSTAGEASDNTGGADAAPTTSASAAATASNGTAPPPFSAGTPQQPYPAPTTMGTGRLPPPAGPAPAGPSPKPEPFQDIRSPFD